MYVFLANRCVDILTTSTYVIIIACYVWTGVKGADAMLILLILLVFSIPTGAAGYLC